MEERRTNVAGISNVAEKKVLPKNYEGRKSKEVEKPENWY